MATIRAFRALRPPPDRVREVAAVPYDVVSTAEARELAAGNPLSFLHVSRPEIDLADGVDVYSDQVYEKARENFERLTRDCPLTMEQEPALYIYRLEVDGHAQTGIAACCSIDEYESDVIRKHERTRRDKEDDRTRHIIAIGAQTGPVFLTYRTINEIDELVSTARKSPPLFDFTAADNVRHTVWILKPEETEQLIEMFDAAPLLYIADGHHRAASAARARDSLRSNNTAHSGQEDYNYFLAVLFPSDQVSILPYNRLVSDLGRMSPEEFLSRLSETVPLRETARPTPSSKGTVCMYLEGKWHSFDLPLDLAKSTDPTAGLDVSVLQDLVLAPILGIRDVRTDRRIEFVGGIRGTVALERAVDSGKAAVAFSIHPVTVDELMAVSDANAIMPPKSTWFEPKLRDGLLSHIIR